MTQNPKAFRLKIDWDDQLTNSKFEHKYGGYPSNGVILPRCSNCNASYHLLFQIDLRDENLSFLNLRDLDYFYMISCLNCATYEKPVYYHLNDHQEIVVERESPGKYISEYPVPLEEHRVSCEKLLDHEYPESENGFYKLPAKRGNHQLGGIPLWVQDEEHISCIKCKREMSYLAMVDTELYIGKDGFRERGHMFGDNGILYVFVCRRCNYFSAVAQGL